MTRRPPRSTLLPYATLFRSWPEDGSPHAVPADLNPLSWQAPELSQVSWLTHSVPASPQFVPSATWLDLQVPEPLHVSAESHWPDEGSPQAGPEALNPVAWEGPRPDPRHLVM